MYSLKRKKHVHFWDIDFNFSRRLSAAPGFTVCRARPNANALSGILAVMVEPAATTALLPIVTGATSVVLDPTNALSPMFVEFFDAPLKLQVIVPAPILVRDPTCKAESMLACKLYLLCNYIQHMAMILSTVVD